MKTIERGLAAFIYFAAAFVVGSLLSLFAGSKAGFTWALITLIGFAILWLKAGSATLEIVEIKGTTLGNTLYKVRRKWNLLNIGLYSYVINPGTNKDLVFSSLSAAKAFVDKGSQKYTSEVVNTDK